MASYKKINIFLIFSATVLFIVIAWVFIKEKVEKTPIQSNQLQLDYTPNKNKDQNSEIASEESILREVEQVDKDGLGSEKKSIAGEVTIETLRSPGDARSISPVPTTTIDSTEFTVTGQIPGTYFFEGSFPVVVYDAEGNQVAANIASASGNWMTVDYVDFSADLSLPSAYIDYKGFITVVLKEDDPSGGEAGVPSETSFQYTLVNEEGKTDDFFVPSAETQEETVTFNLYFSDDSSIHDGEPCPEVYAVSRTVPYTAGVARQALQELVKGPTVDEVISGGFVTHFNPETTFGDITINEGAAKVYINNINVSGNTSQHTACLQQTIRKQLNQTLGQFPTINGYVTTYVNGQYYEQWGFSH